MPGISKGPKILLVSLKRYPKDRLFEGFRNLPNLEVLTQSDTVKNSLTGYSSPNSRCGVFRDTEYF